MMPGVAQRYWTASTLQGKRWLMEKRLEAVELNDITQLRQLLAAQGRLKPRELTAALEIAVMKKSDDYAQCVQLLLQNGANPNAANGSGTYFLHLATDADCHQIVSLLVSHNCDVNISRDDGACALHKAAWQGNVTSLRMLINAGADVTASDAMGRTPLLVAAQENKHEVIFALLSTGCSVNICDHHSRSLLYWAVYHGNLSVVEQILPLCCATVVNKRGPDGVTPAILASYTGRSDILRLLLEAGAKTSIQEDNGMTAIVVAARHDRLECVHMLIRAGNDLNIPDNYGKTPLLLLLDNKDLTRMMLDAGADPNVTSHHGNTCLCLATTHKFVTCAKLLLQYNARIDVTSGDLTSDVDGNKLPLQVAMYGGCLPLTQMLFIASIAMSADLTWLREYLKDENFRGEASTNVNVAAVARWICDVMNDFYKPNEPQTLRATCRTVIRGLLGSRSLWTLIDSLTLPTALRDYLKLRELDSYDASPAS